MNVSPLVRPAMQPTVFVGSPEAAALVGLHQVIVENEGGRECPDCRERDRFSGSR
jgi:hypothetical protein